MLENVLLAAQTLLVQFVSVAFRALDNMPGQLMGGNPVATHGAAFGFLARD
jgi:hypothetical protein